MEVEEEEKGTSSDDYLSSPIDRIRHLRHFQGIIWISRIVKGLYGFQSVYRGLFEFVRNQKSLQWTSFDVPCSSPNIAIRSLS
ncbi:hypothetical protein QJS04_geneDACA019295 [Acorus gramineus]|uniref:Uncharacterized protein n=1 Tax=Acorus gramineus TaxID=55184 RepID=A0AAV9A3I0_ACOGR|nr:hypothetical protein QJS04_geneDACA019295 [Acorus gramineus]